MSSCTFLKVKKYQGDTQYINPDTIQRYTSYAGDLTSVIFGCNDYMLIEMSMENFTKMLQESNYFMKTYDPIKE